MAFALFTAPFAGSSLYGSKPVLPDIQTEYEKWLNLTKTELPALKSLASDVNEFNSDELMKQIRKNVPGYDSMMEKGGGLISSMLSGEVPQDVQDAISRSTAYKSFKGGFAGSQASSALGARDLGLTSLDIAGKGLDSAMRWIGQAKQNTTVPLMDVTQSFLPTDAFYKRQLQANLIEAAPDPVAVGRFNTEMGYLGMALSIFGGSGYQAQTPQNGSQYLNGGNQGMQDWGGGGGGGGGWNEGYNVNSSFNSPSEPAGGFGESGGGSSYGDFGSFGLA